MGQLYQRMEERLKLEGYSYRTQKTYLQYMRQFAALLQERPAAVSSF
ncbi:TPA: hypothetical protein DD712_03480 [Candidatus Acetothermia bacterium]|nr:hypothetical protein [Candidatus Acetothermia bacterium]